MDMKRKEGYKKSAGARIAAIAGRMWVAAAALWLAGSARAQQTAIIPQPVEMETVGTTWTLPATLTVGTTVFPDAELKIFVTASSQVRAQRRYGNLPECL